jgi:ribonucleoside-diphosphate reductase alpha chain
MSLIREIYGEGFNKTPFQVLIQLDRYTVKELDTSKIKVGDVVVAVVDDSDPDHVQKDFGRVTALQGESLSFHGEVKDREYIVPLRRVYYPLDWRWSDAVDRMVLGAMSTDCSYGPGYDGEYKDRLRDAIYKERIVPGGRIQASLGAREQYGKDLNLTAYNCYVIPSPVDSRAGIMETLATMTEIMSRGGGVGINLSTLRPRYAKVYGVNGTSSGSVSWGGVYSYVTGLVEQGGSRRGALMLQLHITHPDILDFIDAKRITGHIENANLSVQITGEFIEAVEKDTDWKLIFPDTRNEHYSSLWGTQCKDIHEWLGMGLPVVVYNTVRARDLYAKICESAWASAEPGFVVYDRMNGGRMQLTQRLIRQDSDGSDLYVLNPKLPEPKAVPWNNTYYYQKNIATNPCLHKDTYMVTENGLQKISQLNARLWNGSEFVKSKAWKTGFKRVFRLMTKSGFEYVITPEHKFLLKDGSWCEAINLIGKDILLDIKEKTWAGTNPHEGIDYRILGFLLGDGGYHKGSGRMKYIYATPEKDKEVISIIEKEFDDSFYVQNGKTVINIPYGTAYADTFNGRIENRLIPDWVLQLPRKEMKYFLQGLFSANGCNLKKYRKIQLGSINKEMLLQVQQMLLLFGIKAKLWYHTKEHQNEFRNGVYTCKQSYQLIISRMSYKRFLDQIGFIQSYKNGYNPSQVFKDEKEYETVILIAELDDAEVWDFSEPNSNKGLTGGAYVHNCGEVPLPPWGICNLVHINLAEFYDPIRCDIRWGLLAETVADAVRFADNIIDYTPYYLLENEEVQKGQRRVGLGTMGLADLLVDLKLKYGSPESLYLIDKLYGFIKNEAYRASAMLAKDRGRFPKYDEKIMEARVPISLDDDVKGLIKVYGLRNSHLLTQAPTGTTATKTGRNGYSVGSGIEPFFALEWTRTSRMGSAREYLGKAKEWLDKHLGEKLPDYFVSAMGTDPDGSVQISPVAHVDVQAAVQRHNDSAISKTINVPGSTSLTSIRGLYQYAFHQGLIGMTIYRDGSRGEQVLTLNEQEKSRTEGRGFYKRPQRLKGETIKTPTPFGKAYMVVNKNESEEVEEVFIKLGKTGADISAIADGLAIALTGMLSPRISHLTQPEKLDWLIKKYRGISGANFAGFGPDRVDSLPDAIAKVLTLLNEPVPSGECNTAPDLKAAKHSGRTSTDICPECGMSTFIRQDGCYTCLPDLGGCGYSKCA